MKNKTLESIFKDIDVLGINGGYSVEQLLSPQDCRMLKSTIKDLQERIDKAIEYIENVKTLNEEDRYITMKWEYGVLFPKLLNILQGSDE